MISTLSIMENADSEAEIVSYGIGIILLNTLLYILNTKIGYNACNDDHFVIQKNLQISAQD